MRIPKLALSISSLLSLALFGSGCMKTIPTREDAGSQRRLATYRSATFDIVPDHPSLEAVTDKLRAEVCDRATANTQAARRTFETVFCDKEETRTGEVNITIRFELLPEADHPPRPLRARCVVILRDTETEEAIGNFVVEENVKDFSSQSMLITSISDRIFRYLTRRR